MKTKKPDIFLGVTICMLVLAAVLCIVILFVNKSGSEEPKNTDSHLASNEVVQTGDSNQPGSTGSSTGTNTNPIQTNPPAPVDLKDIDQEGLKAALDDSLSGLASEWQVMVIDPAKGTKVSSTAKCKIDDWMTANRMAQVFIMGTVFQQAQEGTLVLDDVLEDVKAMITGNDTYAADRLTEKVGGGDAAKGRENVKAFAVANGLQLGFNRPLTGSSGKKNYVTAQQTAELLNLLCTGKLVSEAASKQMLDILLTPAENPEIDLGLTGEGIRYGFIHDVESDTCVCTMGVVQLQNRSFVISVVCNEPYTIDGAKKKAVELVKLTQPYFEGSSN